MIVTLSLDTVGSLGGRGALRTCTAALMFAMLLALSFLARPCVALADEVAPPELKEAQAAAIIDQAGNVLFELNGNQELPPASITKVMTAVVALDCGPSLDEEVELVAPDLGGDSQMADYGDGDRVTFGELLRVMLVLSANDAAYNAAVLTAGSEETFVDLMNQKAADLGMAHTHFMNSHGLEAEGHYASALDLATLSRYALENYPFIAQTVALTQTSTTVRGYAATFSNTDRLLGTFDGMRGVKTGAIANNYTFLGASGRGTVQLYTSVLGCSTFMGRFDDTAALMEWAYGNYRDLALSHGSWVLRLQPYAYDFGLSAIVSEEDAHYGKVWPSGGALSYEGVLCKADRLLDTSAAYGWTHWKQSGRGLASVPRGTRPTPVRVSAWPIFTYPLFEDVQTLGRDSLG